jgi:PAS domain S-box-containing protein
MDTGMVLDNGGHGREDDLLKEIGELREKGDYYKNILESGDKGVWVFNDNYDTVYTNYRMAEMLGSTIDRMIGKSIFEFIDEDSHGRFKDILARCHADNDGQCDVRLRRSDGRGIWALAGFRHFFDKSGRNIGINGTFVDITERKLMEMALRETRDNLEKAQRIGKMGSWVRDFKNDTFDLSGELCHILGLAEEQISIDRVLEMIYPEDKVDHLPNIRSQLYTKGSYSEDIRLVAGDGRLIHCHLEADLVRDADGKPEKAFGILQDITDRKLAEEAEKRLLVELNERVKELTALYGISKILQSPGEIDEVLQEIARILPPAWQYPKYTVVRITFDGKEYNSAPLMGTECVQSARLDTSNGKKGTIEIFYTEKMPDKDEGPFLLEERKLIDSISEMMKRYLEHKQIEMALLEGEEKFRILSETSPFAILFHSGDHIIYSNPAAQKIFEDTEENISKMKFWDFIDPEYQEMVKERGLSRLKGENPQSRYEVKLRTDGSEKWMDITSALVLYKGKPAILTTGMDVTQNKLSEKALREARANAEFFIDIISHDIGNLNHAVLGYLELALDTLTIDGKGKELLVKPMEIVNKSSKLIKDVRLLRQIRSGELEIKKVDACTLLARAVANSVSTNGIHINCSQPAHCEVMANDALEGAFSGIISNMSEFGEGGKVIDIRMDRIEEGGAPYCRFIFEDDGPGISDLLKKRLMSDTWEQDGKTVRRSLGLKFIKALVDAYHGKVSMEDRVAGDHAGGIRIVILLPEII